MLKTGYLLPPLCFAFMMAASAPVVAAGASSNVCAVQRTLHHSAKASWYGPGFHGRKTANGETFNMYALTAAHKTLKLGSRILVENVENGLQIVLRINDRGPYHGDRALDVSKRAADALGFRDDGVARVRLSLCNG
ncbi:MAG: septal ring lytic transglycosylase RlpA family protein [Micavibrio aeruginosavorus]|uniref:Probable endolytic peptidoglycan transglycosylase RlpA n=1 Tax=Micavibrio aeruginosavorus TaxID=349221 RepID=A0A7T5R1W8_9BACT|nr:MAG: septal ring lytic transglycosylase RlpA family protein [Micavibrio aeruginosavorus]